MVKSIAQNISLALLLACCILLSGCGHTHHTNTTHAADYPEYAYLAPTPPMGWNSWNIFAKDINEVNIKAAADAMVASGMRDAGYQYLVLDDAWMDSVYNCADCSGGSHRSHPAFNGLWQFAGPGYWNDPDMLQVGNLKIEDDKVRESANRAHFGLWCILAAPLMAGNDLPNMTDTVKGILTAPEVIAVNQDERGVQGYKVFIDDELEIYNKPLADGTTAVLLLNKGRRKADITVTWEMIGLSGRQPVRDLWKRIDLGIFKDSFTAKGLGQHGNMMLKIGKRGKPLPTASRVPLEKYKITRQGVTSLSDLYYAWRDYSVPVYNSTYEGNPIRIDGKTFEKGFGCRSKAAFMFAGTERGDRLMGTVALDESYEGDNEGRFRIFHEDYFGNRVLWDSGKMTKDSPAREFDIELAGYSCLMLTFDGRNTKDGKRANDVLGVFADPRVIAND